MMDLFGYVEITPEEEDAFDRLTEQEPAEESSGEEKSDDDQHTKP